jgi:hypothetical protein
MARNPQISLKPQDLVILFKLTGVKGQPFKYAQFSESLGVAASELHAGINRLMQARLIIKDQGEIVLVRTAFIEYVLYGASYSFPAVRGSITRGLPTSYAASPLVDFINQPNELPPVWPDPDGGIQGVALYPLYPSVPFAVKKDADLYECLALFDALRSGAAREREIAQQLIREKCS